MCKPSHEHTPPLSVKEPLQYEAREHSSQASEQARLPQAIAASILVAASPHNLTRIFSLHKCSACCTEHTLPGRRSRTQLIPHAPSGCLSAHLQRPHEG